MKIIKISIVALILTLGAQFAKAQVRVGIGVNIGTPVRYVERPYYDDYGRVVYYNRPVVHRYYARPAFYGPRYYRRPVYRNVVYREHFSRGRGYGFGRGHGRW